jgi:hypothetical protein
MRHSHVPGREARHTWIFSSVAGHCGLCSVLLKIRAIEKQTCRGGSRLSQRPDIGDQIVDLVSGQRQIRHGTMRMRQKGAELVVAHSALRYCREARRPLRRRARLNTADDMTIHAPALCDLSAGAGVGLGWGSLGDSDEGQQKRSRDFGQLAAHLFSSRIRRERLSRGEICPAQRADVELAHVVSAYAENQVPLSVRARIWLLHFPHMVLDVAHPRDAPGEGQQSLLFDLGDV